MSDAPSTPGSERRRSERVRREKPDYYDALEFDTKRRGDKVPVGLVTPTRAKRSDKIPYKSPRTPKNLDASGITAWFFPYLVELIGVFDLNCSTDDGSS